jgi:hypothetical protein
MPSAIPPEPPVLPTWKRPAPTKADLPWADISVIDISSFDEHGGKEKLAEQLRHAVRNIKGMRYGRDVAHNIS